MTIRKIITTISAAATIAAGLAVTTQQASADQFRHGFRNGGYHGGGYSRGYDRRGGGWNRGGYGRGGYDRGYYRHRGWSRSNSIGAGILGLGVGAVVGSAIAGSSYDRYEGNRGYYGRGYYEEPQVVYVPVPVQPSYGARSYVGGSTAACAARYRSYDARSNTFLGYDGYRHPCRL